MRLVWEIERERKHVVAGAASFEVAAAAPSQAVAVVALQSSLASTDALPIERARRRSRPWRFL